MLKNIPEAGIFWRSGQILYSCIDILIFSISNICAEQKQQHSNIYRPGITTFVSHTTFLRTALATLNDVIIPVGNFLNPNENKFLFFYDEYFHPSVLPGK